MTGIDWTSIDWWDLPGPSGFLQAATNRIASDDGGIIGLSLPTRRPRRLMEALADTLEAEGGMRAVVVDTATLNSSLSPAHALATAAGASPGAIRSPADFVHSTDLLDMVFLIDGVAATDWPAWELFFRSFRAERVRCGRITAPTIVIVVPQSLPHAEINAALGGDQLWWREIVSRADMHLFVESVLGRGGDLAHRTAVATVAETACWDPDMAEQLAARPIEDQIDPRQLLAGARLSLGTPCWANGLVDVLDGAPHLHTLALLGADQRELLARRVWRAHVGTIFPAIEQVRQTFVHRYFDRLAARLPTSKKFFDVERIYDHPLQLEINDVHYYLKRDIPAWEAVLLSDFKRLRTAMAHMEPADPGLLLRASKSWSLLLARSDALDNVAGWDWPRCGQRLVLLVGPSGAGKTTYAAANYAGEQILSSDAIRDEINGSRDMTGSQEVIFETLRSRARRLLAAGQTVVIDATNLSQKNRLQNAGLVPEDVAVEYVLIDRPMAEKRRDGGWRLEKPRLLQTHADLLAAELEGILAGDGLPNVTVIDCRAPAPVVEAT